MYVTSWLYVATTFVVALMLTLLPMPDWTVWLRPAWVLLVLIYWLTVAPQSLGLGFAWTLGLCLDVLNGTLLGEHALAITVISYFVVRMNNRFRMFPLLQQGLFVFLFVLFYQFIIYCIQGFIGGLPRTWLYWLSPMISMLLWPWLYVILHDCSRRFRTA